MIFQRIIRILIPALLPVLMLVEGVFLYKLNGHFYLRNADPEYHYLMNSTALANGQINLNTDHPGTPLQTLVCLSNRIAFVFSSGDNFTADIIRHPEFYLRIDLYTVLFLSSLLLYLSGAVILRQTKNLTATFLMQSGPFISVSMLTITERMMPETLLLGLVPLYAALLYRNLNQQNHAIGFHPHLWLTLLTGAACISLKFVFLPFALIPIFLSADLKTMRKRLLLFCSFFLLLTFPLLVRMGSFFKWISGILMHSGQHGSGPADIADLNSVMLHISEIWERTPWLILTLVFASAAVSMTFIRSKFKKINKALAFTTAMLLIQLLLIAKHYAPHYLVTAQLIMPFILLISYDSFQFDRNWYKKILSAGVLVLFTLLFLNDDGLHILPEQHLWRAEVAEKKANFKKNMERLNLPQTMILSSDDWNAKPEYALWFGKIMTPNNGIFNKYFNQIYPDRFFHKEGTAQVIDWDNQMLFADTFQEAAILIHRHNDAVAQQLLDALKEQPQASLELLLEEPSLRLSLWLFRK